MNSLWWLALPVIALPIWWHRQRREPARAELLATARFLPRAQPRQVRVWRWSDRFLLLVRCLLLACLISWLADPAVPWRGDTVLLAAGADNAWADRQVAEAGFVGAERIVLPDAQAFSWLRAHEREWRDGARLLIVGDVPMPASQPHLRHRVELRTTAGPFAKTEHRVAIVGKSAAQWRRLFAALDGERHFVVEDAPGGKVELVIWDSAQAPPPAWHAPLWWVGDTSAFPELEHAKQVDGLRYADSPRGRLWTSPAWPPQDADSARALFETWQEIHYPPVAFTAPSQVLEPGKAAFGEQAGGALRDMLGIALVALLALERMLTHARRR
jgi:hypothetical protein